MVRTRLLTLVIAAAIASMSLLTGSADLANARPGEKAERHPHIHKAIVELKEAKRELEKADHDFGGHRVEAIKAIDHAVSQLEKALKFDKK